MLAILFIFEWYYSRENQKIEIILNDWDFKLYALTQIFEAYNKWYRATVTKDGYLPNKCQAKEFAGNVLLYAVCLRPPTVT